MKDEKSATDHTLDVTLKRVDQLHNQVEELKTQLLTKGNRKNCSIPKRRPWIPDNQIGQVQFNFMRFSFTTDRSARNSGIRIGPRISFFLPWSSSVRGLKFFADSDPGRS